MNLIFKKICLSNFRSFIGQHELILNRAPGLYYISGRNELAPELGANGVGKSTALVDSIFWVITGRTIRAPRPGAAIEARWPGLDTKETTLVKLDLSIDGIDYEIKRTRRPNKLTLNWELVEQSRINKLLPISDDAILRTFIIGQFGDGFLDLRAEQQSTLFTELLQLHVWLQAADLSAKRAKTYTQNAATLKNNLSLIEGKLTELATQIHETDTLATKFENEQHAALNRLVEAVRQSKAEYDTFLETAPKAPTDDVQNDQTSRDIPARERAIIRAQGRVREARVKQSQAVSKVSSLSTSLHQNELDLQHYKTENNICPACNQPITDEHTASQIVKLMTLVATQASDLAGWTTVSIECDKDIIKLDKQLLDLQEEIKALREKQVQATLEAAQYEHRHKALEWKWNRARDAYTTETNRHNQFKEQLGRLKLRQTDLEADKLLKGEELQTVEKQIGYFDYWSTGFKEIRLKLIDDTLIELEFATTKHAEALGLVGWRVEFKTERETVAGAISHKFSVFLYAPANEDPIPWESCSGGESQRLQLATTFGLSEVLLSRFGIFPNLEILDEPTGHLSQSGIDDLLENLHNRALELNRSIFMVDHHTINSGNIDGMITIIKDGNGSRIAQEV